VTAGAARAASFGNPDQPPQGAINAKAPGNLRDPGSQSKAIGSQFPSARFRRQPMSAHADGLGLINNAPKLVQNGGGRAR